uniref:Uncharacterized protein n=1 Tax=Candidatus Kentrum sp. TUN TaxID=2126343 RepID=A0A450ZJ17_9GAMM|nr:MAG: hypothetical protein BECKTUN1418F_GA0071002_101610 [Candidatus Kentron sp. TUN]VFK53786.1 MAG: hypothetical protein BECKTUN1418E_GA0071001_101810 [Candidatus Kentron sp. TUN]VFK56502.1 MAG: hypothetical protein BECKTUN1418D_GA0071000_10486 [Candidatus Kentron sp. TUN]
MAKFPNTESDILALAEKIATGMEENAELYPDPPRPIADLRKAKDNYLTAQEAETEARNLWEKAITARQETIQELMDDMKETLSYAENTVDFDDAKLKLIGWHGKK